MSNKRRAGQTITTLAESSPSPAAARRTGAYLLGIDDNTSRLIPLPEVGTFTIGRSCDADLTLEDGTVSRTHAELIAANHEVSIRDLNSRIGTRVNGTRLPAGQVRPLISGDRITFGNAVFYFEYMAPAADHKPILPMWELRRRGEEEIERARATAGELAVFLVTLDGPTSDALLSRIADCLRCCVTQYDTAGALPDNQLCVLKPHIARHAVQSSAERMLVAMATVSAEVRLGVASYPRDGVDIDILIDGARAAATAAVAGHWRFADETTQTATVDDETEMILADDKMRSLFGLARRIARNRGLSVLVHGETGTGKDLFARAIHHYSGSTGRFVTINCATLNDSMAESTLFGHERGAFTGAYSAHRGVFEQADGGTLFLDELGELPARLQATLLRVLEGKPFIPLGSERERSVRCRIVAATNRDLESMVEDGAFRRDLYHRLRGAQLWLPPLRNRRREIVVLAERFLDEACDSMGRDDVPQLSPSALHALQTHTWPGNVRELRQAVSLAVTMLDDAEREIRLEHLPREVQPEAHRAEADRSPAREAPGARPAEPVAAQPASADDTPLLPSLPATGMKLGNWQRDAERHFMRLALARTHGNQTRAARLLSMPLRTFQKYVKKYQLS